MVQIPARKGTGANRAATIAPVGSHQATKLVGALLSQSFERCSAILAIALAILRNRPSARISLALPKPGDTVRRRKSKTRNSRLPSV
jgi:hypothetical protein